MTANSDIELVSATGNTQAVIDAATRAAGPQKLDADGRFFAVVAPAGGKVEVIDLEEKYEKLLDRPRRKTGLYQVHDADSFVTYFDKHGDEESEVWADTTKAIVVGILNAHEDGTEDELEERAGARWEDHQVAYAAMFTEAWKTWTALNGKMLSQVEFAEHIEDRAVDVVEPTAADMLELAQTFRASIGVKFESSKLLSSGEAQLEYRETVDATAGKAGRMDIPQTFALAIRPFEGADPYKVTARLRYRITDGTLRLGYRLDRPEDVLREAFLDVVKQIADRIDVPVLRGSRVPAAVTGGITITGGSLTTSSVLTN